jgi:hypothetical protein
MPHAQPGLLSMFGLHVSFLVLTENSLCWNIFLSTPEHTVSLP